MSFGSVSPSSLLYVWLTILLSLLLLNQHISSVRGSLLPGNSTERMIKTFPIYHLRYWCGSFPLMLCRAAGMYTAALHVPDESLLWKLNIWFAHRWATAFSTNLTSTCWFFYFFILWPKACAHRIPGFTLKFQLLILPLIQCNVNGAWGEVYKYSSSLSSWLAKQRQIFYLLLIYFLSETLHLCKKNNTTLNYSLAWNHLFVFFN